MPVPPSHPPTIRTTWPSRRTAGRIMLTVAAFGVVAAVVGSIVAWQFVGQISRGSDQSLELVGDALVTLEATLDVADELVLTVDEALGNVASTLAIGGTVLTDTAAVAGTTADLADQLAPGLERVEGALGSLVGVAGAIDTTLRQLSRVPFGPDYEPSQPFPDSIEDIRSELGPLATSLRATAVELEAFAESSSSLDRELGLVVTDVQLLRASIAGTAGLVDEYRTTVRSSALLAERTRADLERDLTRSRLLVVVLGLSLAAGQVVPAWLGRELIAGANEARDGAGADSVANPDSRV